MTKGTFDYDFLIIGGGSAGATAAMTAKGFGVRRVAIVEKELLGGTCTNVGCVPSKSFLHAADLVRTVRKAKAYDSAVDGQVIAFEAISRRKNELVASMRDSGTEAMETAGVKVIKGAASFTSPLSVSVDGEELSGEHILLATGAGPAIPPIEGLADVPYLTSTSALAMESLPESILIIGGAYIGLEFASFYHALGVRTVVIEALDRLAANEDEMISEALETALAEQGIEVATETTVRKVSGDASGITVEAEGNGGKEVFSGQSILIATGRAAKFDALNLEAADIEYGRTGITVDKYLQTSSPAVFAAGDLLPPPSLQLEHVAVYEGRLAANNVFSRKRAADYRVVPRVMFSFPEVASVGETAAQARTRVPVVSVALPYRSVPMAQIAEETVGLIRLVADAETGRLLGAHIVGADAGNIVHLAATVMRFDVPVSEVAGTVAAYPTLAQGFYLACGMLSDKLKSR